MVLYTYPHIIWYYTHTHTSYGTIHIPTHHMVLYTYPHIIWYYTHTHTSYGTIHIPTHHMVLYTYPHIIWYYTHTHTCYYPFQASPLSVGQCWWPPIVPGEPCSSGSQSCVWLSQMPCSQNTLPLCLPAFSEVWRERREVGSGGRERGEVGSGGR